MKKKEIIDIIKNELCLNGDKVKKLRTLAIKVIDEFDDDAYQFIGKIDVEHAHILDKFEISISFFHDLDLEIPGFRLSILALSDGGLRMAWMIVDDTGPEAGFFRNYNVLKLNSVKDFKGFSEAQERDILNFLLCYKL